jgi:hypothetical protein
MDAPAAIPDEAGDLLYSYFPGVIDLLGAPRDQPTLEHAEHERPE